MRTESRELLAVGIFGSKSRFGDRIEMLLRRGRTFSPRASAGGVVASALVLSGLMLAGALAPRWIAFAQVEPRPSFEVASVKPGDAGNGHFSVHTDPGEKFTTSNATLRMLIAFAYDLRNHQISGGPNWIDSAKFNIEAKANSGLHIPAGPAGAAQTRLMVRSLLAKRFKFAEHREKRELQVYELVLGKSGSKLKDAADPSKESQGRMAPGRLTGISVPIALLASQLSQQLGRSVIDKTDLTGKYDFSLKWTPDEGATRGGPDAPPPADTSGPSIFTAVQEQLGLRLQSARGPVEILVIDHAEKPDAN
jgi:uncharacterized protein (TIGR03435 family)